MTEFKVFISHSSKDKDAAFALVRELQTRGIACWIAPRDIDPGSDYSEQIIAGLDGSDAILVLISAASLESRHVRSEVAHASGKGLRILPVRLIDIEISGGLRFFVELSQWIDLFPTPHSDVYDQIVQSLRDAPGDIRRRHAKSLPRKALLYGLATSVALSVAVLGVVGYRYYAEIQAERAFEAEMARQQAEFERQQAEFAEASRRRTIDRMTVTPIFRAFDGRLILTGVYRSQIPRDHEISLSLDGQTFEKVPTDTNDSNAMAWEKEIPIPLPDRMIFRIADGQGKTVKDADQIDDAKRQIASVVDGVRAAIEAAEARYACGIRGCDVFKNDLPICSPALTSARLIGQTSDLDLRERFCGADQPGLTFCLPAQDLPDPPVPGEMVSFAFETITGERITADLPVGLSGDRNDNKPGNGMHDGRRWILLRPLADGGASRPVMAVSLEEERALLIHLGLGSCRSAFSNGDYTNRTFEVSADFDGRGFVPIGWQAGTIGLSLINGIEVPLSGGREAAEQALPVAAQALSLRVRDDERRTIGTWTFPVDLPVLVIETRDAKRPAIICSDEDNAPNQLAFHYRNGNGCMPQNRIDFLDVERVEFGNNPGVFEVAFEIRFSGADYLDSKCDPYRGACEPFFFDVPTGWTEVYSRITLRDGQVLEETRHKLEFN